LRVIQVVLSVAWSRDGQYIVSGSMDKTVRVWEADVQVCTHADVFNCMAISVYTHIWHKHVNVCISQHK
jgi:WD40 repeat protein